MIHYKKQRIVNSVGVLFCAQNTQRHLFLLRNDKKAQVWGLPGGKIERNETLREALERECVEELGHWPEDSKLFPIAQFMSPDERFFYHTFYCFVDKEFMPVLNDEHLAYCWVDRKIFPKPLHAGLFNTLSQSIISEKIEIIHDSIK